MKTQIVKPATGLSWSISDCFWTRCACVALIAFAANWGAHGQGTITFNEPWIYSGAVSVRDYYEGGLWFRVVAPSLQPVADYMTRVGSLYTGPGNGTPHMEFSQSYPSAGNYVTFSVTNAYTFGVMSVDLAEPFAPSYAQIPITFNGFYGDGSMVSTTFLTPGNGATTFQTYQFGSEFSSGLVRVDIPSGNWAMDNLVFGNLAVPEPSTYALLLAGGLLFWVMRRRRG